MSGISNSEGENKKPNSGLSHWWYQKISALLMLPITLWFIFILPSFISFGYKSKLEWISSFPNNLLLTIFFVISSYHIKLGLTVVIEDYIHNNRIKKILINIVFVITLSVVLVALVFALFNILELHG